ncbi:transposase family protein [Streptomyces sp. SolWspMP-5a-2]|uniref:transposase family protein n=1 Tax=Streptomyces sp. SolWspMP-5a-2 TaxID=1838281 RepID=UPI000B88E211|nr:hypothetical protein [Streptomyces sp. SID4950]
MTADHQAFLALTHLRCGDTYAQPAGGLGIGTATAYRYTSEALDAMLRLVSAGLSQTWAER